MIWLRNKGGAGQAGSMLAPRRSSARRNSSTPASLLMSPPSNDSAITQRPTLPNSNDSTLQFRGAAQASAIPLVIWRENQ